MLRQDNQSIAAWIAPIVFLIIPVFFIAAMAMDGFGQLSLSFLLDDPLQGGRSGGIRSVIVSTFLLVVSSLMFALPIGMATALALYLYFPKHSRTGKVIRLILDILYSVPSVVYGLFGYALFVSLLGYSILSGALAIAIMILPLFIRIVEQAFHYLPNAYVAASHSLQISEWGFVSRILLPQSVGSIISAIVLSCCRVVSETAVLLFTAGYVLRLPDSLFDSGRSMSVHILDLAMNVPGGFANAAATGLVLLIFVVFFNVAARALGKYSQSKLSGVKS